MKKLILSFCLFLISIHGIGQQLEQVLVELKEDYIWKNHHLIQHNYDADGFLLSTINQDWDNKLNDWVKISKLSYIRIETGVSTENRREIWNASINNWVSTHRTIFRFDDQDRVIESTRLKWEENTWKEITLEHTGYDKKDNIVSKKTFYKKDGEDIWFVMNSYDYEYDKEGDITNYLFESPSKKMRSVYTKDGKGKLTSVIKEEFKSGKWEVYSKEEQHYHHVHGLDFTVQKIWFSLTNEWTNNTRSSYLRDANELIEQNIGYEWLKNEKRWNKISRRTYSYAIEQNEAQENTPIVKVYPNPTSNLIKIDNIPDGLVTIITSFGKQVYRKKNDNSHFKINVSSFPKGYYFIRVNDKSIGNFVKVN